MNERSERDIAAEANGEVLRMTREELHWMLRAAQQNAAGAVLRDWATERAMVQGVMTRAMLRLCDYGESALSSTLVRELQEVIKLTDVTPAQRELLKA